MFHMDIQTRRGARGCEEVLTPELVNYQKDSPAAQRMASSIA